MAIPKKTFDCVTMKRLAQERIRAEYEARKGEFSSFVDFLRAKSRESELVNFLREKIDRARLRKAS